VLIGAPIGKNKMKIDPKFSSHWRTYVLQSVYASIAVFFITLVLGMEHAVVIASIGATSFIVFAMPNNISGQPKRIIGGHCPICYGCLGF
jgi:CBS-domain-containing membrane protein